MFKFVVYIFMALALAGCGSKSATEGKVWGIDISKHQHRVNWERVFKKNPPAFVFLKATEGTLIVDPTYVKHAKILDSLNVLWGAYHFFGHRTNGHDQAISFIRNANLKKGNLLPVLDIEHHRFMVDPKKTVKQAKAFCRTIKQYYGINPIIYCSSKFYESYLADAFPQDRFILWIADYNNEPKHLEWLLWQHTDSHRVDGISGNVDRNVFCEDPEALKKLILR